MTRADELLALAERVEALGGPDREVDAEIALALGIVRERDGNCFYGHRDFSMMVLERGYYDHDGSAPELSAYTASLDAAMTLVPEGMCWRTACFPRGQGVASAMVEGGPERMAATPALALTAAALRARAAIETGAAA
jgi:hypothetical protein